MRRISRPDLEYANIRGPFGPADTQFILGCEARGQRELCRSSQLPRRHLTDRAEALGIRVLDEGDDPLFCDVELPGRLVDASGRKVAELFYKAAHYDRDAFVSWEHDYPGPQP